MKNFDNFETFNAGTQRPSPKFPGDMQAPAEGRQITRAFVDPKFGAGYLTQSGPPPAGAAATPVTAPDEQPIPPNPTPQFPVAAEAPPPAPNFPADAGASPDNVVPFPNESGDVVGPPTPTIAQQIELEQANHAAFIEQHAQVAAQLAAGQIPAAPTPPVPPVVAQNTPAPQKALPQFVGPGGKPQWQQSNPRPIDVDHLYGAYKTAGRSDPQSSADQTQRYYERAFGRFQKTHSRMDANRVTGFNARIALRNE